MTAEDEWIEGLRNEIPEYEELASKLESGNEKIGWIDAAGNFKDNSAFWAKKYRKVAEDYRAIIARHEAKIGGGDGAGI